jgi:hypothetical protein
MNGRYQPLIWAGLALWLMASIVVRLVGDLIFNPGSPVLLGLVLASILLVWSITGPFFRSLELTAEEHPLAALWLVVLPLLLEIPTFLFHRLVFPNMGEARMVYYGAYLFFFYGLVLALVLGRNK